MKEKSIILPLIICIGIPLVVGLYSSVLTNTAMVEFNNMNKPPLSPPAWLFPVVWTILYILMGIACFLIYRSDSNLRSVTLFLYGVQLVMNFAWSIIFFNYDMYWFALVWLLIMWATLISILILTSQFSFMAMICLVPLVLWTTFAAYLNMMIARLN